MTFSNSSEGITLFTVPFGISCRLGQAQAEEIALHGQLHIFQMSTITQLKFEEPAFGCIIKNSSGLESLGYNLFAGNVQIRRLQVHRSTLSVDVL